MVTDTTYQSNPNSPNSPPTQYFYSIPIGPGISYKIQVAASAKRIPASRFPVRFKGISSVSEYFENGIYKYTVGNESVFENAKKLKDQLRSSNYKDAFLVPFYKGLRVNYK